MKKLISCLMLVAMLASMLTVGASAAASPHADRAKVLNAAYGTATIDGKLDDAYLKGDKVESFVLKGYNSYADKVDQVKTTFYAYLMYDDSKLYVFGEVFDDSLVTAEPKAKDHKNDSIEYYFYLDDFNAAPEDKLYAQLIHPGSALFRFHTPTVCPTDCDDPSYHIPASAGFAMMVNIGELKSEVKRTLTNTGYIVEMAVEIPAECKAAVAAGKTIGFGVQVNDNITGEDKRDALLWSNNNLGDPQKTGPFMLLAKDAAPATTTAAPETTKAPETTAAPAVTTAAPATTPSTADISPVFGLALLAAAAALFLARRARG